MNIPITSQTQGERMPSRVESCEVWLFIGFLARPVVRNCTFRVIRFWIKYMTTVPDDRVISTHMKRDFVEIEPSGCLCAAYFIGSFWRARSHIHVISASNHNSHFRQNIKNKTTLSARLLVLQRSTDDESRIHDELLP
jgi:hypothetical protein